MKLKLSAIFVICSFMFIVSAFSHGVDDANDVNAYTWDPNPDRMFSMQLADKISEKSEVTFFDTVEFMMLVVHGHYKNFQEDLDFLVRHNIAHGIKLNEKDVVNLGTVSLMCARTLNIKNSLMYNIFGGKRYAVRACAAIGLVPDNSGEYDKVSGEELIEIMRKLASYSGIQR